MPCALRGCPHGHAPPSLAATTRELSPLPELQVDEIEAGRVPMLRVMKMAKRGRVPRVGGALGSGAAPRRANLRDQLATSVPRIHPRFCPIPAHQVPRAASRAKFAPFPTSSSRPNADLRPPGGPGRGSRPARCGFSSALRCICAPMARSGVRLRRVDCGAPR